jgi:hypothetical protein
VGHLHHVFLGCVVLYLKNGQVLSGLVHGRFVRGLLFYRRVSLAEHFVEVERCVKGRRSIGVRLCSLSLHLLVYLLQLELPRRV